ncbi:shikimate dehydrogenase [Halomonas sp. MCCC 1A17488]|uniref:Shikimate dehydrogenase (NADP(+)) n=1 Tax=Billgrantia sulfidoxydans TaxID=2733484 RepID=A0ABX7W7R6_9GAMM|nr:MULTISPECIES: shikimate dehydrogenase [Halomonas]MCE8017836.1 shikimate dehydrogenase [Halomonas sp. MCCC 1A17488]MCG3241169.1 shikimate dehydrogenase [Halomonas sp. MCCC 1A17488]QPP49021.1 shikimate dehydrogenase [Halomonas sp. SS10-MC5]QTP56358.1 shikimate dehydrogenase [Halomonas sulfidoxydans]
MTDRYCVFGNPIAHSKSPAIHAAFAEQTGEGIDYTAIAAPLDDFPGAWRRFTAEGGRGANVTVPFKEAACRLCDTLSRRAQRAGAVNTLILGGNGQTHGDTTDGVGLVRDLARHGVNLAGARILVLGAGGAVRGVLEPLLTAGPLGVRIANRTAAKAAALAQDFADLGDIEGGGFDDVGKGYDLVINGTSASLAGDLPPLPDDLFAPGATAYDMMYGAEPTVFLRWAAERGALAVDGLGMLVEQAAESFYQWRGRRPDTTPVLEALRRAL